MVRGKRKSSSSPAIGRVLVVEDDALLALDIEQSLLDAGATAVQICPTTEQALKALREDKPDVIVLDIHLADRDDGWAIAELVDSVGPKPPRIVFSTGSPEDIPAGIAELGTVLEKPYAPEDLVRAVSGPARKGLLARLKR